MLAAPMTSNTREQNGEEWVSSAHGDRVLHREIFVSDCCNHVIAMSCCVDHRKRALVSSLDFDIPEEKRQNGFDRYIECTRTICEHSRELITISTAKNNRSSIFSLVRAMSIALIVQKIVSLTSYSFCIICKGTNSSCSPERNRTGTWI